MMDWRNILAFYFSLPLLSLVVEAGEYCVSRGRARYCSNGCCSNVCCLSAYTIAGIVFGCIAFIAFVAALVFCFCKKKKQSGTVMNVPARVMVINSSNNQPYPYSATQPLPPGYAPQYNPMFSTSGPPPYGFSNGAPPSAFTYNNPDNTGATNSSPFAAAANANQDKKSSK